MKLQIVPDINIDNTKVLGMLENIHCYRPLIKRINKTVVNKEVFYETESQYTTVYEILMTKDNVSFFIGFDDRVKDNIMTELNICWKDATYRPTNECWMLPNSKELELGEHYFLSLKTNFKAEYPLSNILETQRLLRNNEEILIRIEMQPVSDTWYRELEECIKNFNNGKMTTKNLFSTKDLLFRAGSLTLDAAYGAIDLVNDFVSDTPIEHDRVIDSKYSKLLRTGLSENTKEKGRYNGYRTKVIISTNSERTDTVFKNIEKAFNTMAGDNRFILVDKSKYKNLLSSKELAQIMQLPTKYYQQLYSMANIDTREIDIPPELTNGRILIGSMKYKGVTKDTYWPDNKNILSLPKIIIGPMGSGKSEFTKRFCIDSGRKGDGVIVLDFIKDCDVSESIAKHVDVIKINLADHTRLSALAYPEMPPGEDPWERLKAANILARQSEYLINSVTDADTGLLTAPMLRYLSAAAMVVYIHPGKTLDDVFKCLKNWQIRNEYIRQAKYSGCFAEDDDIFYDLQDLHERDSDGKIIGTRDHLINGLINRISALNRDIYLKKMLKAEVNYNQNFANWMDEGKVVLIQIPESTFTNKAIKDTLVTYYMSRIWLAALQRKNYDKVCHVVTDEIHQVPTAAALVGNIITEARKFGVDFYFTIHYLKQFRQLHDAIRSAGCSYMLLAGTEKENIKALEEELKPFTIEEGLKQKPFHSLNIINYGNQYAKFISKLPTPI
jgi:hypothetical protein